MQGRRQVGTKWFMEEITGDEDHAPVIFILLYNFKSSYIHIVHIIYTTCEIIHTMESAFLTWRKIRCSFLTQADRSTKRSLLYVVNKVVVS